MKKRTFAEKWLPVILKAATIVVSAIYLISFCAYLSLYSDTMKLAGIDSAIGADFVLGMLHSTGGLIVIFIAAASVVLLLLRAARELWARIFIWGALLLSVTNGEALFANLANASANGLAGVSAYLPQVMLAAALVALIAQWNSRDKTVACFVSLAALVLSIVSTISFVMVVQSEMQYTLDLIGEIQPIYMTQYYILCTMPFVIVLFTAMIFVSTLSERSFNISFLALTESEAEDVNHIEDQFEQLTEDVQIMAEQGEYIDGVKVKKHFSAKKVNNQQESKEESAQKSTDIEKINKKEDTEKD